MKKLIIIKYGELTTKHDNINYFIKTLKNNLDESLKDINHNIIFDRGRMYIESDNFDEVLNVASKTFGIHEINIGYEFNDINFDNLKNNLISLLQDKEFTTFKVVTKRANKSYPLDSMEISRELGGVVLKKFKNKKVDVKNPELEINVEIRFNKAYIYFEKIKGIGGYPVGTLGKGILMLSGGIDSPVAGYMALKRGIDIECLYFESPPHTSMEAKNKVLKLANILNDYSGNIKVHVVPFTTIQETIYRFCPEDYMITIMRRMMYRIAHKFAKMHKIPIIVNGESVGQVASQTITSMSVINEVTNMPIIRPVACLDKLEIIEIAKKIGTYETSILPFEDCCTIFVPKHPVINPKLEKCVLAESKFNFDKMIDECIENIETITNLEPNNYDDLL